MDPQLKRYIDPLNFSKFEVSMVCTHCGKARVNGDTIGFADRLLLDLVGFETVAIGDTCPLCKDGVFVALKDAERVWQGG